MAAPYVGDGYINMGGSSGAGYNSRGNAAGTGWRHTTAELVQTPNYSRRQHHTEATDTILVACVAAVAAAGIGS